MAVRLVSGVPMLNVFDALSGGNNIHSLLQEMKLPNHLLENTVFYVDPQWGSDVVEEDNHGLSKDKAFLSIQACLDYVVTYHHLDKYNVTIMLLSGEYLLDEPLQLHQYSTHNGHIIIQGEDDGVVIKGTDISLVNIVPYAWYVIDSIRFDLTATTGSATRYGVFCNHFTKVDINNCTFSVSCNENDCTSHCIMIQCYSHSRTGINNCVFASSDVRTKVNTSVFSGGGYSTTTCSGNIIITGMYSTVISVSECAYVKAGGTWSGTATGKRYSAVSGGCINVGNKGTEWIPGSTAGSIDADAGCWYK